MPLKEDWQEEVLKKKLNLCRDFQSEWLNPAPMEKQPHFSRRWGTSLSPPVGTGEDSSQEIGVFILSEGRHQSKWIPECSVAESACMAEALKERRTHGTEPHEGLQVRQEQLKWVTGVTDIFLGVKTQACLPCREQTLRQSPPPGLSQ